MGNLFRAGAVSLMLVGSVLAQNQPASGQPEALALSGGKATLTEVPVRAVALFGSGVGYFEHWRWTTCSGSTQNSQYYTRLLTKLNDQETRIESCRARSTG